MAGSARYIYNNIISGSQAPAWEPIFLQSSALQHHKENGSVCMIQTLPKQSLGRNLRSQAGAWERGL